MKFFFIEILSIHIFLASVNALQCFEGSDHQYDVKRGTVCPTGKDRCYLSTRFENGISTNIVQSGCIQSGYWEDVPDGGCGSSDKGRWWTCYCKTDNCNDPTINCSATTQKVFTFLKRSSEW